MLDGLSRCTACPRLAAFVAEARAAHPDWHAAPVPPWGDGDGALLVVGLAPGLRGANRTGKPFCGDQSGAWVYGALHRAGWAATPEPGTTLTGATITNAVKCVPPQNKPTPGEITTCRQLWLREEIASSPASVIVALGRVAWDTLRALAGGEGPAFAHQVEHRLSLGGRFRWLLGSYHPSPLNTRTGRLSAAAFDAVFTRARALAALEGA